MEAFRSQSTLFHRAYPCPATSGFESISTISSAGQNLSSMERKLPWSDSSISRNVFRIAQRARMWRSSASQPTEAGKLGAGIRYDDGMLRVRGRVLDWSAKMTRPHAE